MATVASMAMVTGVSGVAGVAGVAPFAAPAWAEQPPVSVTAMPPTPPASVTAMPAAPAAAPPPPPTGASVPRTPKAPAQQDPKVLIGPVTREAVEAASPAWVQAGVEAKPDLEAARALAAVEPGAEVTVLLGTWCGDSRREVSRLWRALDEIGATAQGGPGGGLPFTLRYIAVDEEKRRPEADVAAAGLQYVPTLIVRRGGQEVGRIVERSPHGVEIDLLALLQGKASGLVSASPRAAAAASVPAPKSP